MPRRFQRRQFGRSQRRKTLWVQNEITTTDRQSVGAATSVIYQQFDLRSTPNQIAVGGTIVRTRGLLNVYSDAIAVQEQPFGAAGIAVVDGEAFDAGIASLPTPYTEGDDKDWLWHTYWSGFTAFVSIGASGG